jgi:AcrR family transcriptional regulator
MAAKPQKKKNGDTPFGRDEIKEAVLDATEKLLNEYSPNEITVRQIAKIAGINHALIHRHFGTKDNVIMEVHERMALKMDSAISHIDRLDGNAGLLFRTSEQNRSRRILLTRAMIAGVDPHLMQHQFPVMRRLVDLVKKKKSETENPTKYDAEILASFFSAMVMGWFLYEPFFLAATNLEDRDREEVNEQIVQILEDCVENLC